MKHYYIQYPLFNSSTDSVPIETLHSLYKFDKLHVIDTLDATDDFVDANIVLEKALKYPEKFINVDVDENSNVVVLIKGVFYLELKNSFISVDIRSNKFVIGDLFCITKFIETDTFLLNGKDTTNVLVNCNEDISRYDFSIKKITTWSNCLQVYFLGGLMKIQVDYNKKRINILGGDLVSLDSYLYDYVINLNKLRNENFNTIYRYLKFSASYIKVSDMLKIFNDNSLALSSTTIDAWIDFYINCLAKSEEKELKALYNMIETFSDSSKKVALSKKLFF